ncbi:DUF4007 family protein [uncultured Pontibacter sp.]|uniref:DUF4007 family protein n=1 Tax=uncultured Pontibacter sp. TaxID=453356 RepID=UPI00262D08DA|nr:DUF4007 family protein [uncultured Pontibacter sp.]
MIVEQEQQIKYTFSGHEKFQCRQLWLKKGYDYIESGKAFSDEDSVIELGVGKNMVSSIRHWLKAFGITDSNDQITDFGTLLLSSNGFDPFLEDDASLWLLHYHLVKSAYASTFYLIFNEFRKDKLLFDADLYDAYIKRKSSITPYLNHNRNTVHTDFEIFKKMYLSSDEKSKSVEDSFSGLLTDLNLIKVTLKEADDFIQKKKKVTEFYSIENAERDSIPVEIILYAILDNYQDSISIGLNSLEQDFNSPGAVFALSKAGLAAKLEEAEKKYSFISYTDHAGIKELQIKEKVEAVEMLRKYYDAK